MTAGRINQTENWNLVGSSHAIRPAFAPRLFALLLCLIQVASASLVLAQNEAAAQEEAEEELLGIDADFEFSEENFDQWVFGVQTPDHGLKHITSLLTLSIGAIDHTCGLTEEQVAKLELAGQGDIKRFYDDLAVLRARFMKVRHNRNAVGEFYQEIVPLQARVKAGLFNDASLFRKVLSRSLSDEQASAYEQAEWDRRQFRYHAKLKLVIAMLERTMPLRAEQRERFIQVLEDETLPPKTFGQYDYYLVLYQLSTVPDGKLKPIFDVAQWKVLTQHMVQGQAMKVFLQQQKVLP